MKPVEFTRNSWFYRWYMRRHRQVFNWVKEPENICELGSKSLYFSFLTIIFFLIWGLCFVSAVMVFAFIGYGLNELFQIYSSDNWIGFLVFFCAGVISTTVIIGVIVGIAWGCQKIIGMIFKRRFRQQTPSIIGTWYQSWKEKSCVRISFK